MENTKSKTKGDGAMRSFGGWFARVVLVFLVFVGVGVADVPKTVIVTTQQVKDYVKNLPQQNQKFANKAIAVGDKFANLYFNGYAIYDEEIEDSWNKTFNPIMTLSGDEWRKIWISGIGDDKKGFVVTTCDKMYLRNISFDNNDVNLQYEALVFGMDNEQTAAPYKFIKLNERLIFEVTVGKAMKITNVRFLTKNSYIETKKNKLSGLHNSLKDGIKINKSMTVVEGFWLERQRMKNKINEAIKNTEEASSICKDY
jgi:hypothetical protein